MSLESITVRQDDRANAFVEAHKRAGFTPTETVFLARQKFRFSRGTLRGLRMGPTMLMDFTQAAGKRISTALDTIKSSSDLESYRKNWLMTWVGNSKHASDENAIKLLNFIYGATLTEWIQSWVDIERPLKSVDGWEAATAKVGDLMQRVELRNDETIVPVPLRQALKETGLHSLSWNKFLYPTPEDEAQLGGALVAFNKGLQKQTGLTGGVLGVGGGVRLHLDDNTVVDSGGVFSNSLRIHSVRTGKNAFGTTQIRLPSYLGFRTLGHEWFHAFDCTIGNVHEHEMSSRRSNTPAGMAVAQLAATVEHSEGEVDNALRNVLGYLQNHPEHLSDKGYELLTAFDRQVAQGQPEGGWRQWYLDTSSDPAHHRASVRSLALLGAQATGDFQIDNNGSVAQGWLNIAPDSYYEKPEEQLAFAFERACLHTRHLPSSAWQPVFAVRNCVPSEWRHANEVISGFFASPEIVAQWEALNNAPEKSPLLDSTAARRLEQRRAARQR